MGLLQKLLNAPPPAYTVPYQHEPRASITTSAELMEAVMQALGGPSTSGLSVTHTSAQSTPAFGTAVRVISETMASLPVHLYRKRAEGRGRDPQPDHAVMRLLTRKPNSFQTAFHFRELLTRHACVYGKGVAYKNKVRGVVRELLPIHAKRVTINQDDTWETTVAVTVSNGEKKTYGLDEVFILLGPSDNGWDGIDTVSQYKDAIGLSIAQDLYAAKMFAQGTRIAGVVQMPDGVKMSQEAYDRAKDSFAELFSGVDNAHKTPILEEGAEFKQVGQTAEDAQLLEARKYQRSIVAGLLRVPPHLVNDLDKATFSNIENLARQFVDYAIIPWMLRWEGAVDSQLLADRELDAGYYSKWDARGLLRGDAKTRAGFYNTMRQIGAFNANDVLEREDMPPREDDEGDTYWRPANMELDPPAEDDERSGDVQPEQD